MPNNLEREAIRILNDIVGVEEHLRSGTYGHSEGWSTASEGVQRDQRERLVALRAKLARTLKYVPQAGLESLRRLLDADLALDREFLDGQLRAAELGTDRISYRNLPPERWE